MNPNKRPKFGRNAILEVFGGLIPGLSHAIRRDFMTAIIVFGVAIVCHVGAYAIAGRAARIDAVFVDGLAPPEWGTTTHLLAAGRQVPREPEAALLVAVGLAVHVWAAVVAVQGPLRNRDVVR